MQHPELINRVTKFSKIWKLNIMLLVSIMVVGTFAVSYAGTTTAATNNKIWGKSCSSVR